MLRIRADAKGLTLTAEIEARVPHIVVGDQPHLRQILVNLLSNAVKFTEHGGVILRVDWCEDRAVFEVRDTGHGIAPDDMEKLFTPFVQTEAGLKAEEGTGLGLAISSTLAQLMDGALTVTSELGRGSCFVLEIALPEADAAVERMERSANALRKVVGLAENQPEYRILVADDLEDNRVVLVTLLRLVGFDVREARDGVEAIEVWRDWRPHLIWMDKRMPRMDGVAATRAIREEEARDHNDPVKIIALSASALQHEWGDILAAGCDDFQPKPFHENAIFEKMANQLGIEYLYQDEPEGPGAAEVLTAARLEELPSEWIASLETAIAGGDLQQARALVDEISARDAALAAALRKAIDEFDLERIEVALDGLAGNA